MGGIEDDIRNPDGRGRHSETLTKEEKKRGRYSSEKQRSEKLDTVSSQLGGRNMEDMRREVEIRRPREKTGEAEIRRLRKKTEEATK